MSSVQDPWSRAAFDALGFGVIQCDGEARALVVNSVAREMAKGGAFSISKSGALTAADALASRRLATLAAEAMAGKTGAVRLPEKNGASIAVFVSPLVAAEGERRVLLTMRRENDHRLDASRLRDLFKLSPTQAALCIHLVGGDTFEEAAGRLAIAVSTARSHFQAILVRTGAGNLRELLALLSTLPPVG